MSKRDVIVILISVMVGSVPLAGKAMDIVQDGQAVAVIVAAKAGGGLAQGDVRKERLLRQGQARPRVGKRHTVRSDRSTPEGCTVDYEA